jgi:hypothetical protein
MRGKFDTPITFSRAEVGVIRELLNTPDKPILCPNQVCNRGGFISMQPRGGSVATN